MGGKWLDWLEKLPVGADRPWIGYVAAVLLPAAGVPLRWAGGEALGHQYPYITLLPAVVVAGFLFGARPGIIAGCVSWALGNYFFVPPENSWKFDSTAIASIYFYAIIVAADIGLIYLLQRGNRALRIERERSRVRSDQRELMFHELQHRVSNKLQIIASLLTLQRRTVTDPDARRVLDDAARRVGLIGRISRALHDPDRQGLGVGVFLEQVGRDIIDTSGAPDVALVIDADPGLEFHRDAAVPIALILCESISNVLEHGFGPTGRGEIRIVAIRLDPERVRLCIIDNGAGVPEGFDAANAGSLGLQIATSLARQLDGSYTLKPGAGRGAVAELVVRA